MHKSQIESLARIQFSSVAQSCLILCNPMDCSTPGFLVHHQSRSLLKLMSTELVMTQNHLILSSPSPPAFNLSQHQGLFQGVSSSLQVAKILEFQFSISPSNAYSGLISFRMDWLYLSPCCPRTLKSLLQHHSSKASILRRSAFFIVQFSHP